MILFGKIINDLSSTCSNINDVLNLSVNEFKDKLKLLTDYEEVYYYCINGVNSFILDELNDRKRNNKVLEVDIHINHESITEYCEYMLSPKKLPKNKLDRYVEKVMNSANKCIDSQIFGPLALRKKNGVYICTLNDATLTEQVYKLRNMKLNAIDRSKIYIAQLDKNAEATKKELARILKYDPHNYNKIIELQRKYTQQLENINELVGSMAM